VFNFVNGEGPASYAFPTASTPDSLPAPVDSAPLSSPRFIFYSHDGCGLGHLRRNLAIAAAVTKAAPDASVLLLTGSIELGARGLAPNVEIVALPALRKLGNGRYDARRLPITRTELRLVRRRIISAAVECFRPDVLLIDKHPMGVGGELRPALERLPASWASPRSPFSSRPCARCSRRLSSARVGPGGGATLCGPWSRAAHATGVSVA
jgi:hypothetical protein